MGSLLPVGETVIDVTICIPAIPPRRQTHLTQAVDSVLRQERACSLAVAMDETKAGAWVTRNRAAAMASTEWIGFLDDDDSLHPHHVGRLLQIADEQLADMVWGWYLVVGGHDPFPHYRGRQYDPAQPHIVPITYLIRRELFEETRGFMPDGIGSWDNQDQGIFDDAIAAGGKLFAAEEITWTWNHHGRNTSGMPDRW